ncbi:MAG: NAD(P)-dependent alcohol dehydrogenase [Pseudomonadota bacterium]|nr:NAD(P)-dependent alcohol dehydrogenase [Pseudomonadota bacterium]
MTTHTIRAYAAKAPHAELERHDYDAGPLPADEVEIKVHYCGVCHTDLAMIDNEWGISSYPVVAGHEIVGEITALGSAARGLAVGQMVGVGYNAASCLHCDPCMGGQHNACSQAVPTVVRMGGFADRVRVQWPWAIALPAQLDAATAGPLLCGGIAVFQPLLQHHVRGSARVGVIGVGGLGHMALGFFNAWGCEVSAFVNDLGQQDEIMALGAHHVRSSADPAALTDEQGSFELIVSTVGAALDWNGFLGLLKPEGKLHVLGGSLKPLEIQTFSLITGNKAVAGSSGGSPLQMREMVAFAARKRVAPKVEMFPMSRINDALQHLRAGKAHYRVVLHNDFA